jgi:hypothetical protein
MRWALYVARTGEERSVQDMVGKAGGKRSLGRRRLRWEDKFKIGLEVKWRSWTGLIWLRIGTSGKLL